MRRWLVLLAPFAAVPLVALACDDTASIGTGPTLDLDSSLPSFDATTSNLDAGADADAATGPAVTVLAVTRAGKPLAGIPVIFHDANGAVLESRTTGADGKATSTMTPLPTMATALVANGSTRHDLVTWTTVADGDTLAVRVPADADGDELAGPVGTLQVTTPNTFEANVYKVGGCGSNASAVTIRASCDSARSVLAAATLDGKFAWAKGISLVTDGGTGQATTGAFSDATTFQLTATNVPSGTLYVAEGDISEGAVYRSIGLPFTLTGGAATFTVPNGFAEARQVGIQWQSGRSVRWAAARVPATATGTAIDLAGALDPFTALTVAGADIARPTASWTIASTASTSGGMVTLGFPGADANQAYRWSFVLPPGATSLAAPALPAEAAAFLPTASVATSGTSQVVFVKSAALSAAAFRQGAALAFDLATESDLFGDLPLPADGTYFSTAWVNPAVVTTTH